jgi:hypothetical protein
VDGAAAPATLDATLELRPPDLVPRVRGWSVHPECDCTAAVRAFLPTLPGDAVAPPLGGRDPRQGRMGG